MSNEVTTTNGANLPAVPADYKTFLVPMANAELDEALIDLIEDQDTKGYEDSPDVLPYVNIRQKDIKDGRKTVQPAGHFRIKDRMNPGIPDADGEVGLIVTVLSDRAGRVYWKNLTDDKPTCKSMDGVHGVGDPGGECKNCPLGQWKQDGTRPDCAQHINLLCLDHTCQMPYVLNLGRSGLRPWNDFKGYMKKQKVKVGDKYYSVPLHFMKIRITTEYKEDPKPHYVPVFTLVESLSPTMVQLMKSHRSSFAFKFESTVEAVDMKDEDDPDRMNAVETEYSELPPDVDPVVENAEAENRPNKDGDDDLPF